MAYEENSDALGASIFGGDPQAALAQPAISPTDDNATIPPPDPQGQGGPSVSPGVLDALKRLLGGSGEAAAAPSPQQPTSGVPTPPPGLFGPNANTNAMPAPSGGFTPGAGDAGQPPVPLPTPDPRPMAMTATPLYAPRTPPLPPGANAGGPQSPPISLAPPMPPGARPSAAPQTGGLGGLLASLGLNTGPRSSFAPGLAAGLAGMTGPGKLAAFSSSMGKAMQGGQSADAARAKADADASNTHFDQSSTAFRNMMMAQQAGSTQAKTNAEIAFLTARTAALGNNATASEKDQYDKMVVVDQDVKAYRHEKSVTLREKWKAQYTSPEQQQADTEKLEKEINQYRNAGYKRYGIDPEKAEKIRTAGQTKENPIDVKAKGWTREQFAANVPPDTWYINPSDGKPYIRTAPVAPQGAAPVQNGGAPPQAAPPQAAPAMNMNATSTQRPLPTEPRPGRTEDDDNTEEE